MTRPWIACCDDADLAVELSRAAQAVGLAVEPTVGGVAELEGEGPLLWVTARPPDPEDLARIALRSRGGGAATVLCAAATRRLPLHELAASLGLVATWDVEAAATAAALIEGGGRLAHLASVRALPVSLRARLPTPATGHDSKAGRLELAETGQLRWVGRGAKPPGVPLGPPALARQVLEALAPLEAPTWSADYEHTPNPERERASEVLFGPERRLSDPASKAALAPYGIPTPHEELCTSPSRAAAEAARMGFPVRITLASPDLRAWDEPDLRVDGVDNAARVRDVYRQLTALASERNPRARVLGVTVTQTRIARALLGVRVRPLEEGVTWVDIGFADPHGTAAADATWLAVPCEPEALERALRRLRASDLLLPPGSAAQRADNCERLAALLNQLHAFTADFPAEVREIRLHPVALLLPGGLEVREAAVSVTDAYARDL